MTITLTSIRLKSLWHFFFLLSLHGFKIARQAKAQPGFRTLKNTGVGYWHYTCSAWSNEADMKNFMRHGAHLQAMKVSAQLAQEIRTYTYEGEQLPTWKEAKRLLLKNGRVLTYQ